MSDLIGRMLGRYKILAQLGEGGMATVYKAHDTLLQRDVAVKVIRRGAFPPEQLDHILKRFEREARETARLTHPNIVPVIDYGEVEALPYLVMPYLSGGTLKDLLGKPMPWQDAVRLLLPVAEALAYAHEQKIIHRDIKPSNILLTAGGQPLLTDFGLVKILDLQDGQTLTASGVGIGTPGYMSLEQGMGKPVDARTDVYSLGVVLYELITGQKPYRADTPPEIILKQATEPLPKASRFVPDLPETVEQVLQKALARQPEDRFEDMDHFSAALAGLLEASGETAGTTRRISRQAVPAPPSITQLTVPQGESGETVQQDMGWHSSPSQPTGWTTDSPPPPPKKMSWLPWLLGLGGLLSICLVAAIVFAVLYFQDRNSGSPAPPTTATSLPGSLPAELPPTASSEAPLLSPTLTLAVPEAPILLAYVSGSSYESENADVLLADEHGRIVTCLACAPCYEGEPSVSADGRYAVYQAACPGPETDLMLVSTGGYGATALTSTATLSEREPAFSPDGSQIAYQVLASNLDRNQNGELYVMDAGGGGKRSLGIYGRGPAWSPDGNKLAYMATAGGIWQIYVYDFTTARTRQVTNCVVNCRWPAWSPDGAYLVYNTTLSATSMDPDAIYSIRADGSGSPKLVVDVEGGAGRPSWSSSGWIAFNTLFGIEIVQPGGSSRQVFIADEDAYAASWSR